MSPDDFWQTCDRPVPLRLLQTGDVDEDMDINARRPGPQSHFKQKIDHYSSNSSILYDNESISP